MCETYIKEVVEDVDSGSFGLHIKGMLSCSSLTLGIR